MYQNKIILECLKIILVLESSTYSFMSYHQDLNTSRNPYILEDTCLSGERYA